MDADYNYDSEEEVDYSKMDMVSIFLGTNARMVIAMVMIISWIQLSEISATFLDLNKTF